jgi:hypothetical protein
VFVRRLAPHDEPIGVDAIRRIVRDAFRRVGIPHGRGHALRHTVACRIVNQGGSIKEVADVLRHRSLNTSMIYAKVTMARCLASPCLGPGARHERPYQPAEPGSSSTWPSDACLGFNSQHAASPTGELRALCGTSAITDR